MARSFVFLALSENAWGETTLGVRLARELHGRGDRVRFLALRQSGRLLRREAFEVNTLSRVSYAYAEKAIAKAAREVGADALVLADIDQCQYFFQAQERDPDLLGDLGLPVLGIDTWHRERTGTTKDVLGKASRQGLAADKLAFATPLRPVPIVAPDLSPGSYRNTPAPARADADARREVRARFGLDGAARAVLFCTASWQQASYRRAAMRRLQQALPRLLGESLPPEARLVHVGPEPLDLGDLLGERYQHHGTLPPDTFGALLASVDLLVSANVSATTLTRAVASGVPAALLWSSGAGREGLAPFALWPIGWWDYLAPILRNNVYLDAVEPLELGDPERLRERLAALLFDAAERDALRERQARYMQLVSALPSGAAAVDRALG